MNNTIDKLKQQIEFSTRTSSFGMFDRTQELESLYNQFIAAMDDDFNTPKAIAILFELVTMVNDWLMPGQLPNETSLQKVVTTFKEMGGTILGIIPYHRESGAMANGKLETDLMQLILDLRSEVRAQKLWALSDKIRDRLHHLGITLEDKKEGTTWRRS